MHDLFWRALQGREHVWMPRSFAKNWFTWCFPEACRLFSF